MILCTSCFVWHAVIVCPHLRSYSVQAFVESKVCIKNLQACITVALDLVKLPHEGESDLERKSAKREVTHMHTRTPVTFTISEYSLCVV